MSVISLRFDPVYRTRSSNYWEEDMFNLFLFFSSSRDDGFGSRHQCWCDVVNFDGCLPRL